MDKTGNPAQEWKDGHLGFPQGQSQGQRQGNGSTAVLEVGRGSGDWRSHFISISLNVFAWTRS